jgi:hypothetical protein
VVTPLPRTLPLIDERIVRAALQSGDRRVPARSNLIIARGVDTARENSGELELRDDLTGRGGSFIETHGFGPMGHRLSPIADAVRGSGHGNRA